MERSSGGALHDLTALEQAAAIRAGDLSPVELAEHYAIRAERLDPEVGAFITLEPDRAVEEAARLIRAGLPEGPLAGLVTGIKDLHPTAGVRTTFGSAVFADFVPDADDEVVSRHRRAGLISLGKTNTPEFGSPCYTESSVARPAVTPWDLRRMAGGSSGGAAAAVAAGLVPLAAGSDGGGSIRIPASCCGLVGVKPTRGRVSAAPSYGEITGLATVGPLARTVADAAALLDVLSGRAVGDPFWAPEPEQSFLAGLTDPLPRLRIARFVAPVIAESAVDPVCVQAWEQTSRVLAGLGHEIVDIDRPLTPADIDAFETCWAVLTGLSTVGLDPDQRALLQPLTRWLGERGEAISGPLFGLALGQLRRHAAGVLERLQPFDAVLTPTLARPPALIGELRDDDDPAGDFAAQKAFTPWTSLWNVTGSPAVSLPVALAPGSPDGAEPPLPIGVMLAARPGEDALLLRLAAQLETAMPWSERRPPCWWADQPISRSAGAPDVGSRRRRRAPRSRIAQ